MKQLNLMCLCLALHALCTPCADFRFFMFSLNLNLLNLQIKCILVIFLMKWVYKQFFHHLLPVFYTMYCPYSRHTEITFFKCLMCGQTFNSWLHSCLV